MLLTCNAFYRQHQSGDRAIRLARIGCNSSRSALWSQPESPRSSKFASTPSYASSLEKGCVVWFLFDKEPRDRSHWPRYSEPRDGLQQPQTSRERFRRAPHHHYVAVTEPGKKRPYQAAARYWSPEGVREQASRKENPGYAATSVSTSSSYEDRSGECSVSISARWLSEKGIV